MGSEKAADGKAAMQSCRSALSRERCRRLVSAGARLLPWDLPFTLLPGAKWLCLSWTFYDSARRVLPAACCSVELVLRLRSPDSQRGPSVGFISSTGHRLPTCCTGISLYFKPGLGTSPNPSGLHKECVSPRQRVCGWCKHESEEQAFNSLAYNTILGDHYKTVCILSGFHGKSCCRFHVLGFGFCL